MAMTGELEEVLKALGVHHIRVRKQATALTFNNQPKVKYHPMYLGIVLVGGMFGSGISKEDLEECLRHEHISIAHMTSKAFVLRYDYGGKDRNGLPLGNEIIVTSDRRYYEVMKRRHGALELQDSEPAYMFS